MEKQKILHLTKKYARETHVKALPREESSLPDWTDHVALFC